MAIIFICKDDSLDSFCIHEIHYEKGKSSFLYLVFLRSIINVIFGYHNLSYSNITNLQCQLIFAWSLKRRLLKRCLFFSYSSRKRRAGGGRVSRGEGTWIKSSESRNSVRVKKNCRPKISLADRRLYKLWAKISNHAVCTFLINIFFDVYQKLECNLVFLTPVLSPTEEPGRDPPFHLYPSDADPKNICKNTMYIFGYR